MRLDEPEERSGEGTLAATGRADDPDFLAGLDREGHVLQDVRQVGSVPNPEVPDLNLALRPIRRRPRLDNLGRLRWVPSQ